MRAAAFDASLSMYLAWRDAQEYERITKAQAYAEAHPRETWTDSLNTIYFMQSASGGPIKIGITSDVEKRRKALELHEDMIVLATKSGNIKEERALHRQFAHLRVRREWFEPAPELLTYIDELSTNGRPV